MPTSEHPPQSSWTFNSCSCCDINMGCGDDPRASPRDLNCAVSIAGSCPQATATVANVTVSVDNPLVTGPGECADLAGEDGCERNWSSLCTCNYYWEIDPADVPTCGPFIYSVLLQCMPNDEVFQTPGDCPHVNIKYHRCYWQCTVIVGRAHFVGFGNLHADPGDPCTPEDECHLVQDCETCHWRQTFGPGPDVCCETCPPCGDCLGDEVRQGDAGWHCSGTTGCVSCGPCPDGLQCTGGCEPECRKCIIDMADPFPQTADPDCYGGCNGITQTWFYLYKITTCDGNPDYILGANPNACTNTPAKDTGDFFLQSQCGPDDYVIFSCPGATPMTAAEKKPVKQTVAGAGTELRTLTTMAGIPACSSCTADADTMNRNGLDWCKANVGPIAERIKRRGDQLGWFTKFSAAAKLAVHGIILNPADPYRALVELAIQRADKKV